MSIGISSFPCSCSGYAISLGQYIISKQDSTPGGSKNRHYEIWDMTYKKRGIIPLFFVSHKTYDTVASTFIIPLISWA